MKKKVVLLGATGSIGKNTINIIRQFPQKFELAGFSYHSNENIAKEIQKEFPLSKSLCTKEITSLCLDCSEPTNKFIPTDWIKNALATFKAFFCEAKPDIVLNGIAGAVGLTASYASCNLGLPLALANKESVVLAHHILQNECKKHKSEIIPVDSEHWAIFQLLNMRKKQEISKIIITASGGAFRDLPKERLAHVTLADAFVHPTWNMGKKITIDSATLANKALEVIEATKLFSVSCKDIIVTIHKESIVHSMVQTKGGTIYAECSPPNMQTPILGALCHPDMMEEYLSPLDFTKNFSLSFSPPRYKDFPMLKIGFDVAEKGKAYPIAFNAANEVAVGAFMAGKISFLDIPKVVEKTLQNDWNFDVGSIEEVMEMDSKARELSLAFLRSL